MQGGDTSKVFFFNLKLHSTLCAIVLTGVSPVDCDKLEPESDLTFYNGSKDNQISFAPPPPPHGLHHMFGSSGQPYREDQGGLHTHHLQINLHWRQMSQQL